MFAQVNIFTPLPQGRLENRQIGWRRIFPSSSFQFVNIPYDICKQKGQDCETTEATLPETKSEFASENRPFAPSQKEMNHLPTIECQGAKCMFQGG